MTWVVSPDIQSQLSEFLFVHVVIPINKATGDFPASTDKFEHRGPVGYYNLDAVYIYTSSHELLSRSYANGMHHFITFEVIMLSMIYCPDHTQMKCIILLHLKE